MKYWPLDVLMRYDDWVVVVRVAGDIDAWEEGQNRWEPVFRVRRLNSSAKFRISEHAKARVCFADQSELLLPGPVEVQLHDSDYPCYDTSKVINMLTCKMGERILRFFGKQYRFEARPAGSIRPDGNYTSPGAARG